MSSQLIRPAAEFKPPQLTTSGRSDRPPNTSLKLSSAALAIVFVPNLVWFLLYWLPELRFAPVDQVLLSQSAPLASPVVVSAGTPLAAGPTGLTSVLALVLMAGVLLLHLLCRAKAWPARLPILPLSVALAAVAVFQLVMWLRQGRFADTVTGVLLLAVLAGLLLVLARSATGVDTARLPARSGSLRPWVLFALSVALPLAVGRLFFGPPLRESAALLPPDLRWSALWSLPSLWLYLAGCAAGLLVWALAALLPPWTGRRIGRAVAALVIAIGPGLVLAGNHAQDSAAQRASDLHATSPANALPQLCLAWWQEAPPQRTLALSGPGCRRVSVFTGYDLLAQRTSSVSFGYFGHLRTPEGARITASTESALYGDTLVAVGRSRHSRHPDVVVGVDFSTGTESWRSTCRTGALRVRLAGVSNGDKPAAGRRTLPGEPPSVVIRCGTQQRVLSPATGRPLN